MQKETLQPLSGFRDYQGSAKELLLGLLRDTFARYGFKPLETPALEKGEVLLSKYGDEANKLLYMFEDNGQRRVGLRYDLTVPLARFVAGNINELVLPYKRYEVGPVWRAEKPQKGRYRQFYQADIDIIGAPEFESEKLLFQVAASIAKALDVKLTCKVSDRRIINEILKDMLVPDDRFARVLQIIDKKDKITPEKLTEELKELLKSPEKVNDLITKLDSPFEGNDYKVADMAQYLNDLGVEAKIDVSLVRGLDYYTGSVFEFGVEGYPTTIIGGGRYDKLVEDLIDKQIPAVGLSFGVDRFIDCLGEDKIVEKLGRQTVFVVRPEVELEGFDVWLDTLRTKFNVDLFLKSIEIGLQLKYANRQRYTTVYIPKAEDWANSQVVVKDMATGDQKLEHIN